MKFFYFFLFMATLGSMGCSKPVEKWPEREYFHGPEEIALCQAIEKQDIEAIDKLVAEGVDLNARGDEGMRFLLWAFSVEKSFKRLLELGADPNFTFENDFKICGFSFTKGDSLLMLSAGKFFPNFRTYRALLMKHGADPNLGSIPPLYLACAMAFQDEDLKMVTQLVEAGADLNASDSPRAISYNVSVCAIGDHYKVLLYLLESGAEYRPHTKPGGQMQRILLKKREEYDKFLKKLASGEWKPKTKFEKRSVVGLAAGNVEREKVIAWLEARGVSFDKPVPQAESQERPKPFRVKPKKKEIPKAK